MVPRRAIEVVERDDDEESSEELSGSSSSDDVEDEPLQNEDVSNVIPQLIAVGPKKLKIALQGSTTGKGDVCKVCGKSGHRAGFVGSVYMDCPNKPCYLCKQVDAAVLKLHTRRCCCLEFHHSSNSIVVSGDKKGAIGIWNFDQIDSVRMAADPGVQAVHERTVYTSVHRAILNTIRFMPWLGGSMSCITSSSDGLVKLVDLETGDFNELVHLNPNGFTTPAAWLMMYGMDTTEALRVAVSGDSEGRVHVIDPRLSMERATVAMLQLHKPGSKVVSVSAHPLDANVLMTAGNDHAARIFDVRLMSSNADSAAAAAASTSGGSGGKRVPRARYTPHHSQLVQMDHGRVVNAAYFSPATGRKILTTCQDNRVRVWDYALSAAAGPDREIVHSHDFNRYLTPFKAEWDAKDLGENTFVIGRYISEDFGGVALHPVDIMDAGSGRLLRQLVDTNLTHICPVNKMHPRRDLIVTGSSRSLYLWAPVNEEEPAEGAHASGVANGAGALTSGGAAANCAKGAGVAGALLRRQSLAFRAFDADPDGGGKGAGSGKKRQRGSSGGVAEDKGGKAPRGGKARPPDSDSD